MCHESIQSLKIINRLVRLGYGGFLVERGVGIQSIIEIRASLKHLSCSKKLKIERPHDYKKVESFIYHFDKIYLSRKIIF